MKVLLALLMAGKLGKLLVTAGTMALSVFAYALLFGWPYAVGLVALIGVHEAGHFLAARNSGLRVGAPVFIPFVGAWIALEHTELDAQTEAHVALAGPVLGTAGAYLCYLVAEQTGERLWLALAYAGFFLNLFNLIPLRPLDGGRVVNAVSSRLWFVGLPVLGIVFLWNPSPMLIVIAVMALPDMIARWRGRQVEDPRRAMAWPARLKYGAAYLGLAAGLSALAFQLHGRLAQHA